MGQEIARRDDGFMPVPLSRPLAKKLNQIQGAAILERAQIEAEEQNAAYKVDRRNTNVSVVTSHLVENAAVLSQEITSVTRDNPGLEMILRPLVEDMVIIGRAGIRWYAARPL